MSQSTRVDDDIQRILEHIDSSRVSVRDRSNLKGILSSTATCNNHLSSDNESSNGSFAGEDDDDNNDNDDHDNVDNSDDNDDSDDNATEDSDTSSKFAALTNKGKANRNRTNDLPWLGLIDLKIIMRLKASKFLFLGSMLVIGIIVCSITYWLLSMQTKNENEQSFAVYSKSMEDSFKFQIQNIVEVNRALGRTISASCGSNHQIFPYVTLKGFEAYAFEARKKGHYSEIMYAPVVNDERKWLQFSIKAHSWYNQSKRIYDVLEPGQNRSDEGREFQNYDYMYQFNEVDLIAMNATGHGSTSSQRHVMFPTLYTSPPPSINATTFQNVDLSSIESFNTVGLASRTLKDAVFSPFGTSFSVMTGASIVEKWEGRSPQSIAAQPVFATLSSSSDVVGFLFGIMEWDNFLLSLLPMGVNDVTVVLRNSCDQAATYQLQDGNLLFVNGSDVHDSKYNKQRRTFGLEGGNSSSSEVVGDVPGHCYMFVDLYPTTAFQESTSSPLPIILTCVIGAIFGATILVFLFYDYIVENRNQKVLNVASKVNDFIISLFPTTVVQQLLTDKETSEKDKRRSTISRMSGNFGNRHTTLRSFLNNGGQSASMYNAKQPSYDHRHGEYYATKPIADLFPECTVMFADIVGFTAWSSSREPTQVFILLETIYHAFDYISLRRRVFKVETIGDCYVAVCGLPDPRKDHAVVMARFSRDCMNHMYSLTKRLENTLGPDTGDLAMRVGLHSGPVIGGVLRGEKARFQLFGDTMNTASRIESTGAANCIHTSQETAELIMNAGKSSWLTQRQDKVHAKGKGVITTYWLELESGGTNRSEGGIDSSQHIDKIDNTDELETTFVTSLEVDDKTKRLINWNCEVLRRLLNQIIQRRESLGNQNRQNLEVIENNFLFQPNEGKLIIDEVKEVITLPLFDPKTSSQFCNQDIQISESASQQLQLYVTEIASLYRDNSFHNFEHASHVTMSVVKLLSRIVAPSEADILQQDVESDSYSLHDHTYGITSDPLTQFACVLSALIHDLDHPGVPNAQLVAENHSLASRFNNKSVAEQNSVDLAWNILLSEKYKDLRAAIYSDEVELMRFRSLVVNSVMATDIIDKDLKDLRNARWDKTFNKTQSSSIAEDDYVSVNRKATIVIEHLIQASDVAHTMQHWHVYRKWNELFFEECYHAYKSERGSVDPCTNWYKGEMGFFDFYIIPLAKKLKDCGVFGVSSDEYLNYAIKNRAEWEIRGLEIVNEMVERLCIAKENGNSNVVGTENEGKQI